MPCDCDCDCANFYRDDNTTGYTPAERAALNAELSNLLDGVDHEDHADLVRAFSDEVARQTPPPTQRRPGCTCDLALVGEVGPAADCDLHGNG